MASPFTSTSSIYTVVFKLYDMQIYVNKVLHVDAINTH